MLLFAVLRQPTLLKRQAKTDARERGEVREHLVGYLAGVAAHAIRVQGYGGVEPPRKFDAYRGSDTLPSLSGRPENVPGELLA